MNRILFLLLLIFVQTNIYSQTNYCEDENCKSSKFPYMFCTKAEDGSIIPQTFCTENPRGLDPKIPLKQKDFCIIYDHYSYNWEINPDNGQYYNDVLYKKHNNIDEIVFVNSKHTAG